MTKLDPEIVRLWEMGFGFHWLRRKSKIPISEGWQKGPRLTLEQLEDKHRPGFNSGVRLGSASRIGEGYLAVIDVDVKSDDPKHQREAMAWLGKHYPEALNAPKVLSGRGNGSAHYYVLVKDPKVKGRSKKSKDEIRVKMPSTAPKGREREILTLDEQARGIKLRAAWEVSLMCERRQTVFVNSVHPDTGNIYKWEKPPTKPDDFPFLSEVTKADDTVLQTFFKPVEFVEVDVEKLGLPDGEMRALIDGTPDNSLAILNVCKTLARNQIPDNVILSVLTDTQFALGQSAHEHAGNTTDRQRAAKWVNNYRLTRAKVAVNGGSVFDLQMNLLKEIASFGEWTKELELGGKPPRIKPTLLNVQLIFANCCDDPVFLRRDSFAVRDTFACNTPWGNTKGQKRSANNDDVLLARKWLGGKFRLDAPTNVVQDAFSVTAVENQYHPLRDYLNGLPLWDGVPRVETAFKRYLDADMPEPYLSDVSRKFFLACVKRAFEPGCKFDQVPILEGMQGRGKSSFVRYLVSDKWFMDALPSMHDKDAALYLNGIWVCELGELATLNKSGIEAVKGFITRTEDKYRPPYGQTRGEFPRTTLFVGTTDQKEYLVDLAGNRRYWPIAINQCDFKALLRDRDRLWAEAMFMYQFDEEYLDLEGKAREQLKEIHGERRVEGENETLIDAWNNWAKDNETPKWVRIAELFRPGMPFWDQKHQNYKAIAEILRKRGFKKKHTENGNIWIRMNSEK